MSSRFNRLMTFYSGLVLLAFSYCVKSAESSSKESATERQLQQIELLLNQNPKEARQAINSLKAKWQQQLTMDNLKLFTLDCEQHLALGQSKQAEEIAKHGLQLFLSFEQQPVYGDMMICYGLASELLGNIKKANQFYERAIRLAENIQHQELLTVAYRTRGDIRAYHGTVESALQDLHKAYRIAEENNDELNLLLAKNSLANLYSYIKDFEQALDYYLDIYEHAKNKNKKVDLAAISYNLARVYQELNQKQKSDKHFSESYQLSQEIGDDAGIAYALKGMGIIALTEERIEVAKAQLEESAVLFNALGEKLQNAQIKIYLGSVYQKLGDNRKSIETYRSAIEYFEEKSSLLNLRNGYQSLAKTLAAIGDHQQAFLAQEKFHEYYEKHIQEERNKRITDMRVAFDTERKEHENKLLSEKNRFTTLQLEKKTEVARFQFWILILASLLVITLFFQIWRYVKTKKTLEVLARTDELTLLANRRHIMEFIEREFSRSQRGGSALSLVMIDIDYFKQFNDKYGHKVGDRVLQNVAKVCLPLLRKSDILGRIGGEEFLLFLPNTNEDDAFAIAERCRKAVSEIPTPLIGDEERVTISSGVVTYHEMMASIDDMLNKADMALYQAKNQGRNQTCIAE